MPVLALNLPVSQPEPVLLVENKLEVGRHRFSLVVVDDCGNASEPVTLVVAVRAKVDAASSKCAPDSR